MCQRCETASARQLSACRRCVRALQPVPCEKQKSIHLGATKRALLQLVAERGQVTSTEIKQRGGRQLLTQMRHLVKAGLVSATRQIGTATRHPECVYTVGAG